MFFISSKTIACSCKWGGNFIRVAKNSELVIKGKIIEHIYHTEDGKKFKNHEDFVKAQIDKDFDYFYGTGESIRVEIIEILKGKEERKIIEIFDTDGADCRASVRDFKNGNIYIFSTYKPHRKGQKLPNESDNDYAIGGCYESTLKYSTETNQVNGMIRGKSNRRKNIKYCYEKLKRKIT